MFLRYLAKHHNAKIVIFSRYITAFAEFNQSLAYFILFSYLQLIIMLPCGSLNLFSGVKLWIGWGPQRRRKEL